MGTPSVSLVIPTYNRADLISETIESALRQTRKFSEIIVIDDGSIDKTAEVLKIFKGQITVKTISNHGVQYARNLGVQLAKNELVVLCDSDDLLHEKYLEVTATWMEANIHQDILYTNFSTFDKTTTHDDKFSQCPFDFLEGAMADGPIAYNIPNLLLRSIEFQALFSSGLLFRKSFYQKLNGYDPKLNLNPAVTP